MISGLKVAVLIPAYNESDRLSGLLARMPQDVVDTVLVVSDGSTDGTPDAVRMAGGVVIERSERGGPGPSIRDGLRYLQGIDCEVVVVMAANGKHSPEQIPDLVVPLVEEGFDLVRGSRHSAGAYHENIPWHRQILTLVFTCLFNLFLWTKVTDATGGFQAYRLSVLDDPRIDLWQPWLGRYEVETYLFAKLLMLGYRWKEVPVRITYPARGQTYTRARVVIDWWGYFRPVVLLSLRIKH